MFISESELFKNLSNAALESIKRHSFERDCEGDHLVFHAGEEANDFYILANGSVALVMGPAEEMCFVVSRPGEVFGWSALVEPYRYQASARCMVPSHLLVIPRQAVEETSRDYPADGTAIFKNLAGIVTRKLREAYQNIVSESDLEGIVSVTNEQLERVA